MRKIVFFLAISSLALCSAFAWEPNGRKSIFSMAYPVPLYWEPFVEGMDWSLYAPPEEAKEEPTAVVPEAAEILEESSEDHNAVLVDGDDEVVFFICCIMFLINLMIITVINVEAVKRRKDIH